MPSLELLLSQQPMPLKRICQKNVRNEKQNVIFLDPFKYVRNVGHIPINQLLMNRVLMFLKASKLKLLMTPSTSPKGSLAQVLFATRASGNVERDEKSISMKSFSMASYAQFPAAITCASMTFRFRLQRSVEGADDGMC